MEVDHTDLDRHPHPHVAVDIALLTLQARTLHALLLRRAEPPYRGQPSLPGGFVRQPESVDDAAARVLAAKCRLSSVFVEQLYTFGEPKRDPRGRVVSIAHYALVPVATLQPTLSDPELRLWRVKVPWPGLEGGPVQIVDDQGRVQRLAFDHDRILGTAVQRLRGKIDYAPVGFELLPDEFTLLDLLEVHEAVLGRELNKDSFRRRLLASGLLVATGRRRGGESFRPAALYRFRPKRSKKS